ncbi:MAG: GNAT family N-acetyltransferase [Thermoguttaceae bacterium]
MIRPCTASDVSTIHEIINEAAAAYHGVIPDDRWREPYMSMDELQDELANGVAFWGFEEDGELCGVMGIQDRGDVCLIRHAYVRLTHQRGGVGTQLLRSLESTTQKPILIGTWASAVWAVAFYERNGYQRVSEAEKNRLLHRYWRIPERQVETSVVLANRPRNEKFRDHA